MKTFIIQGRSSNGRFIPAQSYGYTAIEAVEYNNWFRSEQVYDYVLNSSLRFKSIGVGAPEAIDFNYLRTDCVPVGSVEYVLTWLKLMGIPNVLPLNIPQELWCFVKRDICIDKLLNKRGDWYMKSLSDFKSPDNRMLNLDNYAGTESMKYFLTKYIPDIISEWRIFVFNKKILGVKCYLGDEWVLPDREYIESIVEAYDKRSYTLDVMVYDDGVENVTDIVELHDFFACGLYGFENMQYLPLMWSNTISDLLKRRSV